MPSGLLQLVRYSNQDLFFTGNPQITFFKTVYRRYTNFAMDTIRHTFQQADSSLLVDKPRVIRMKVERYADLIHDMYFSFTLPEIKSPGDVKFRWIKNIGLNIINYAYIYIGGQIIDRHYGEWLHVWNELTLPKEKEDVYNEMIGNIPEIYDPENAPGNNGVYPASDVNTDFIPSIREHNIFVPMMFWFNRNPGMALPLIALGNYEVEIECELKPLVELYTVIDTDPSSDTYGYRVKPNPLVSSQGIQNYLSSTTITNTNDAGNKVLQRFDINPVIYITHIYLDKDERERFAFKSHEYLIEQTYKISFPGLDGSHSLDLSLNHPVKEIIWVSKRSDSVERNDWNNYTNWTNEKIPPYSPSYINEYAETPQITANNFTYYKSPSIITNSILLFDGYERTMDLESKYYNMVQTFKYHRRCPKNGIHCYSFALDCDRFPQPTGQANMSHFAKIKLNLTTQPISSTESYKFIVNVYTIQYNILRLEGGMGALVFAN